jgi:prevent-host-death family protein
MFSVPDPDPVDGSSARDYNSHMIKTLRDSKAKLSELVALASRGEDVLISVRGKVRARLTRAAADGGPADRASWVIELKRLQKSCGKRATRDTVEGILAQQREDRM